MTLKDAITVLDNLGGVCSNDPTYEAIHIAILAIKKQIAAEPDDVFDDNIGTEFDINYELALVGYCPICTHEVQVGMNYCNNCGQKLGKFKLSNKRGSD